MKMLLVNGGARKSWNTAQLLDQVADGAKAKGAEVEVVRLADLRYRGCISCFACKRIGGQSYGRCVVQDDLQPVLQKAHEADVLVLGTPVYFSAETSMMRGFQERLWFQYYLYSAIKPPLSPRKKAAALLYTMNIRQDQLDEYATSPVVDRAKAIMERLFAPCEVLLACDTLQFDDYSKYDTDMWDVAAKQKRHAEVFPRELEEAFALGGRLAE